MATTTRTSKGTTSRGKSGTTASRGSGGHNPSGNSNSTRGSSGSKSTGAHRQSANRSRDSERRFATNSWVEAARDRPYTTAAVAAGVAGVGAFLWSRRSQISDLAEAGYEKVSEFASNRFGSESEFRSQREITEGPLTLKETGEDPIDEPIEAGSVAY